MDKNENDMPKKVGDKDGMQIKKHLSEKIRRDRSKEDKQVG